jgi:hypothetical protein
VKFRRASRLVGFWVAAGALLLGSTLGCAAQAEDPQIHLRRATERTTFSNDEIRDGFFKTAFRGELQFDRPDERIRKFDEPIRVFVVNRGTPDRDLVPTIRSHFGAERAKRIQQALAPECLSGIGKDQRFRIRRAEAIMPVDTGDFSFYDCAYEELLQGLGVINDDNSVPWTMFNDDVQMGFFDVYDQYLVNILYDPRVRPGMTKDEVDKLLPDVLQTVRARLGDANLAPVRDANQRFARSPGRTAEK